MPIVDTKLYSELCWNRLRGIDESSAKLVREAVLEVVLELRKSLTTVQQSSGYVPPLVQEFGTKEWIRKGPAIGLTKSHNTKDGIALTLIGEAHRAAVKRSDKIDFPKDEERGRAVIRALHGPEFGSKPLVIVERGLQFIYDMSNYPGICLNEADLTKAVIMGTVVGDGSMNLAYTPKQRSLCVAGYLLACFEADEAMRQVVLFFGDNHWDITEFIEDFGTTLSSPVLGRKRSYMRIGSLLEIYKQKLLNPQQDGKQETIDWDELSLF